MQFLAVLRKPFACARKIGTSSRKGTFTWGSRDVWWPGLSPVNGTFCVIGTSSRNSTFIGIGSYGKKGTVASEAQGAMCGTARARNGLATRPTGKKFSATTSGWRCDKKCGQAKGTVSRKGTLSGKRYPMVCTVPFYVLGGKGSYGDLRYLKDLCQQTVIKEPLRGCRYPFGVIR